MMPLFYFIGFCVTLELVSTESLNVTNGAQDYFKASQLQLLHSIELAEMKIASVDESFASRLDVIHYEKHQVLHEIHQLNQSLTSLQYLSLVRKYCIQKYASHLVTRSIARSQLKTCHDQAKFEIKSLTSKATASVNEAKTYAIAKFLENVRSCSNSHVKNNTALELCYVEYVDLATHTVGKHLKNVHDELENSSHKSSIISHKAVRCSYQVTSKVLKSLGAFLRDIVNCQRDFVEETTLKQNQNDEQNKNAQIEDKIDLNAIQSENENIIQQEYSEEQ